MRILCIGDIIGNIGLLRLVKDLPQIKRDNNIDFVIANGENAAEGSGITEKQYRELLKAGTNVVTMGDHTWGKKEIFKFINETNIVRPANLSHKIPGTGYTILECKGKIICVINVLGRAFMSVNSDNPFECIEKLLQKVKADIYVVDMHAEATAEKIALARYFDGKISAVYGTHTHVQTADEQILPKGTGFISDVGMTGPTDSVIGMEVEVSFKRFITSIPEKYKAAEGPTCINGVIFEIDENTGKTIAVERVNLK